MFDKQKVGAPFLHQETFRDYDGRYEIGSLGVDRFFKTDYYQEGKGRVFYFSGVISFFFAK